MKLSLNHSEVNKRIGKTIAKYRQISGFTQEQIAEILDVGNETVSRIERGLIMPNVARLFELAEIFGCHAADLIGEASPRAVDHGHHVHHMISSLEDEDRQLMMTFLEMLVARLKRV